MLLRVKLKGSGQEGDPWRAPLPTYNLLTWNSSAGWALVVIPDEVMGLGPADLAGEGVENTLHGVYLPNPSPALLAKLHARLDERYQEHAGEFKIEPA